VRAGNELSGTREMPCALMAADWARDAVMRVDMRQCIVDVGRKSKDFCFEAFKRSSVMYIREDMARGAGYAPRNAKQKRDDVAKQNRDDVAKQKRDDVAKQKQLKLLRQKILNRK
jgi:hypothetical protein